MPSEKPYMPCPKSEDGDGSHTILYDDTTSKGECDCCDAVTDDYMAVAYCNDAARHIADLQREVERLKGQLAAIAKSPVPLTTARERKTNYEETPRRIQP